MHYVVVDTETSGLDSISDRLVEIAGVWRNSETTLLQTFSTLCEPGREIAPSAKAVHHITEEMVKNKPAPVEALNELLFLSRAEFLVAHNAVFDRGFLTALNPLVGDIPWVCTWRAAMHIWPDAESFGNQYLRYWLDLEVDLPPDLYPHRALYDAIVTETLLRRMLETHSIQDLIKLSTLPVLLETVRFGKHRGLRWRDVPSDYMQWCIRQPDMDPDVRHTAAHWLRAQRDLL